MGEVIRCAVYTRKSTEEGLEQDFNSLDAQREACAAYVASQRHEGWVEVPERYEDGGFSGGNMERPGLKKLFEDIRAGRVNTIVVYKIDRLTRSLADFAKMVELFDKHKVSFVSVTQQFNTTTSMGRLTLNVLLSFAQFEREISAERIRDKFAASRAKGMWMGGTVPLGYAVKERKLIVREDEAGLVRRIFDDYVELGSIWRLVERLHREGVTTRSGRPFFFGHLARLLANEVYIGKAVHKGKVYPGLHEGVIDMAVWERVQAMRGEGKREFRHQTRAREGSLLAGKLFDVEGFAMSPLHAQKMGRRYRYYVSQGVIQHRPMKDDTLSRLPAGEIETAVTHGVRDVLHNEDLISRILPKCSHLTFRAAQGLAESWDRLQSGERIILVRTALSRVTVLPGQIELKVSRVGLEKIIAGEPHDTAPSKSDFSHLIPIKLVPVAGGATYISAGGAEVVAGRDMTMVRAVAKAFEWNRMLVAGEVASHNELAKRFGTDARMVRRLLPLAWLAPDIVKAILRGSQPAGLSLARLYKAPAADWAGQRALLGFPPL